MISYLGSFDVLRDFVEVAVELGQFGLHHISAGGPPAGHQNDGLVPDVVHSQTDVPQLLQHALRTDQRTVTVYAISHSLRLGGRAASGLNRELSATCTDQG